MIRSYRFYVVFALLIATVVYIHFHQEITVPVNRPLVEIPVNYQGWRMTNETRFDQRILDVLKPTDYVSRVYRSPDGKNVTLYVGYHSGGKESGPIHSPKHCLPGSGWGQLTLEKAEVPVADGTVPLVKSIYQNGDRKELFLYWFQVKGKSITSEYALKFAEITNSIFFNRKDSAFIRVSVPFEEDEAKAFALGSRFIQSFYPFIQSFLPK